MDGGLFGRTTVEQLSPKVCMVWFGSYYPGQGYTTMYELSQGLARKGWETHVITCKRPGEAAEEEVNGVRVHRADLGRWEFARYIDPRFFRESIRLLRQECFDLVHVYAVVGVSLFPQSVRTHGPLGRPTRWIYDIQAGPFLLDSQLFHRLMNAITRRQCSRYDAVVAICEEVADYVFGPGQRRVAGFSRMGVRVERFRQAFDAAEKAALRQRYGIGPDDFLLIYSGVLEPRRRPEDLVRAMALVAGEEERARLLFVGTGPRLHYLQRRTDELELAGRVVFAGLVDYLEMPLHLASADAALSYIPTRPIGHNLQPFLKTAEYLAGGLPVICSDTPGHRHFIRDGVNGLLCPDDPSALAEAILRLARDPQLLGQLRAGAFASAPRFDWDVVLDKELLPVYRRLLRLDRGPLA